MKRKTISLIVALMMTMTTFLSFPLISEATDKTTQSDASDKVVYEYDKETKTAAVKSFDGSNDEPKEASYECSVVIPETITKDSEEYTVTTIDDKAFENVRSITDIQLPSSITTIGKNAFNCCTNLRTIVLPEGLKAIEDNAFFSCTRLETVQVGSDAEASENVLTLPESLETLGAGAFYGCENISKVIIKSALELGDDADNEGHYAFSGCIGLIEVVFEKSPSKISRQMFARDIILETLVFPDVDSDTEGLEAIEMRAFDGCIELMTFKDEDTSYRVLDIPDSVETIEDKAFNDCARIKTAEIPACTIGNSAFKNCSDMDEVVFNEEDEVIENSNIPSIGREVFSSSGYKLHTKDEDDNTFKMPKNINKIEAGAFTGANLLNFAVADGDSEFAVQDGVLFNKSKDVLIAYPGYRKGAYSVPKNVIKIGDYAFSNSPISDITFPADASITEIGSYAFNGCFELGEIELPDTVAVIGDHAFALCDKITEIDLPKDLKVIEKYSFSDCIELAEVKLAEGVTEIEDNAFAGCFGLGSINVPSTLSKFSPLAFTSSAKLETMDIDDNNNYVTLEDGVLYNKDKTELILCMPGKAGESFEIPSKVKKISDYAFASASGFKEIKATNDDVEIGKYSLGYTAKYDSEDYDRNSEFYLNVPSKDSSIATYAKDNDIAYFTGTPSINDECLILGSGETSQLKINNSVGESVLFTSSDESIAKVDRRSGLVTGVSEGLTYIVASVGTMNFVCEVEVISGEKPAVKDPVEYKMLTSLTQNAVKEWEKNYSDVKNAAVSFDPLDNSNLVEYTSNNYVAIWAKTLSSAEDPRFINESNVIFGEGGYEEYTNIAHNMSLEMSRYSLNENMVVFSGVDEVNKFTSGKTSSLDDMYASIGEDFKSGNKEGEQRYTADWVNSTSIDHAVAFYFGTGSTRTMLEIYAPADFTKGAYLNLFSSFENEKEILLDGGTTFRVLDAGVRKIEIPTPYGETVSDLQRYMKLQIVEAEGAKIGTPVIVEAEQDPPYDPSNAKEYRIKVSDTIVPTEAMDEMMGITTDTEIISMLYNYLMDIMGGAKFESGNTVAWDVTLLDEDDNPVTAENFPAGGAKITLPYPDGVGKNWKDYDFTIVHMFGENGFNRSVGEIEGPMPHKKTEDGLEVVVTALSPFAIHWTLADASDEQDKDNGKVDGESNNGSEVDTGDDMSLLLPLLIMAAALILAVVILITRKRKE